jgi:transposase
MQIDKENLPKDYDTLKDVTIKLLDDFKRIEDALRRAQIDLSMSQYRQYGRKSDYVDPRAVLLFNEVESAVAEDPTAPQDLTSEPVPTSPQAPKSKKRGRRQPIPEHIARVDRVIDLKPEEKRCSTPDCDCEMQLIGEEISESLDYMPAKVVAMRTRRPKYACPKCEENGVKVAPVPAQPIPKSLAAPGLLAHVAVSKYMDALPLHRQEAVFKRIGIELSRTSMARWMIAIADLLNPVVSALQKKILSGPVVHSDETPIQVLKAPDKAVGSDCYMWVIARSDSDSAAVVYNFDQSRSKRVPLAIFAGYQGYLQADGYSGYDELGSWQGVTRIGCWAHCRRKFTDSLKAAGEKLESTAAFEAVTMIRDLYQIEAEIKDFLADEKFKSRQTRSKPILEKIRKWVDKNRPKIPSSSPTGKALTYMENEWKYLERYVDDGRLSIDNNFAERAIRPFAIGRRNWLFADTPAGAQASAAIYSIIESAKANDVEPFDYLRHLLTEIPTDSSPQKIESLLPWNYARRHLC